MSESGASDRDVRERDARDARFFAWDVPGDAHIVALVHEAGEAERSATVVDAIATSIARRREHTLLLSAEPGPSPLDELLGAVESEGLPAALGGRARLTDVAVQRVDRPFVYLPAGRDPEAMQELLEDDVLASFVSRVRDRGGTLFLVVSDRTRLSPSVRELVDGYVTLGEAALANGEGLQTFGRVRFDENEEAEAALPDQRADTPGGASEPEGDEPARDEREVSPTAPAEPEAATEERVPVAEAGRGSWVRHRAAARFPAGLVGGGIGVVAALLGGWWVFANIMADDTSANAGPATVAIAEAAPTSENEVPVDPVAAGLVFSSAPELRFSVLIASYADKVDADDHVARLGSVAGTTLYFSSPTPVRGIIYHRVFAGAIETEAEASSLMDELVRSGEKDEASAWHLRPVRLAYDLGVFADGEGAEARIADLASRGVPSYSLTAELDGRTMYQVYGGAYENERASLPMADILDAAGEPAMLIARHGGAETPSTP